MLVETQGHRGYGYAAPANTLAAFRKAAADPHMKSVEFDVRVTSDGYLVVTHGPEIPGYSATECTPLAVLQSKDLGEGERMPLFAEVVEVCLQGGLIMNVEIKPGADAEKVLETMAVLRSKGALRSCRISSFDRVILQQVMKVEPEVPIGALFNPNVRLVDSEDPSKGVVYDQAPEDFASWFGDHHVAGDSVNLRAKAVLQNPALIQQAKAAGKSVLVWCPSQNDPGYEEGESLYQQLLSLSVDIICTNYPAVLARIVGGLTSAKHNAIINAIRALRQVDGMPTTRSMASKHSICRSAPWVRHQSRRRQFSRTQVAITAALKMRRFCVRGFAQLR